MADMKQIPAAEAKGVLDGTEDAVYLDVRTVEEFAAGHPEGALNVPIVFLGDRGPTPNPDFLAVVEKTIPKAKAVFCGCKSGGRSKMAAAALLGAGYENVVNVAGGFSGARDAGGNTVLAGWEESGHPVGKGEPEGTNYRELKERAGR
ncbi:MAG: rhodanese-like domain-containing protein [Myxococcota bacterium]